MLSDGLENRYFPIFFFTFTAVYSLFITPSTLMTRRRLAVIVCRFFVSTDNALYYRRANVANSSFHKSCLTRFYYFPYN